MSLQERKNKAWKQAEEVAEMVSELRKDVDSAFEELSPYDMDEAVKGNLVPNPEYVPKLLSKEKEVKKSLEELERKAKKAAKLQGEAERELERKLMENFQPSDVTADDAQRAYESGFNSVMDRHYQNASSVVQSLWGAATPASQAGMGEAVKVSERMNSLQKEIDAKRDKLKNM